MAEEHADLYHLGALSSALEAARRQLYSPLTDCTHAVALVSAIEIHVVTAVALVEKLKADIRDRLTYEKHRLGRKK